MSNTLRKRLIRLARRKPELRAQLLPLLRGKEAGPRPYYPTSRMAGRLKRWDSSVFLSLEDARIVGDRRVSSYVAFPDLTPSQKRIAIRSYSHGGCGGLRPGELGPKYAFAPEHYYYPVTRKGDLRGRRVLAIPLAKIKNERYMASLGYEICPDWIDRMEKNGGANIMLASRSKRAGVGYDQSTGKFVRGGIIYFTIDVEDYNIDEDVNEAEDGDRDALDRLTRSGIGFPPDPRKIGRLQDQAIKAASRLFGRRISNEGHDSGGSLVCKFPVSDWKDVKKVESIISRNFVGGDDNIDLGVDYVTAQGFSLYPDENLANGRVWGNSPRSKGDIDDWLREFKPGRSASLRRTRRRVR